MAEPAIALATPPRDHDHVIVLHGATWRDFERFLEMRGDHASPRFAYLEGELQIISPSRSHEWIKSAIGGLIEVWCRERGIDFTPYGAWTLKNEEKERGLEPDECYVLGVDDDPQRPDLAIEVIWTAQRIDKLEIYRKLGVREVWLWEKSAITIKGLRRGRYVTLGSSEVLRGLDHTMLAEFVERRPVSLAEREYAAALRSRSAPRKLKRRS